MIGIVKDFWSLFVAVLLVYAGGYVSFSLLKGIVLSLRSDDWPSVKGKVLKSELEKEKKKKSWGGSIFKSKRNKDSWKVGDRKTYRARVEYEYSVADQEYQGKRISFLKFWSDRNTEQEMADQYRQDSTVRIYYSPNNPKNSVLEPGLTLSRWFFGVIFLLFGLGILAVGTYTLWKGVMDRFF